MIGKKNYNLKSWYKKFRQDILALFSIVNSFTYIYNLKWQADKKNIYKRFVHLLFTLSDISKSNNIFINDTIIDSNKLPFYKFIEITNEKMNSYDNFYDYNGDIIASMYYEMKEFCDYQGNRILSKSYSSYDILNFLFFNLVI